MRTGQENLSGAMTLAGCRRKGAEGPGETEKKDGPIVTRLSEQETDEIARGFVAARRATTILPRFPGRLPETLEDAYRVQERVIALDGRRIVGWKIAMIHPDLRARLGAERICGPIFEGARQDLPRGGTARVAVIAGGFAALEAEFAALFSTDLPAGPDGFAEARIAAAVGSLHAGVEVASSPLAALNEIGPLAVVCDQGNNAGAVVGPALPGWPTAELARLTSEMQIGGKTVGRGSAASVPGGPLGALRFLAEQLAGRGRHLAAGEIVLTGMTTGIHQVVPGMNGRIVFADTPGCALEVVAAERKFSAGL